MPNVTLETTTIPGTNLTPSRIALGIWAIAGWMWGGSDDQESIRTIRNAIDRDITIIDTAPVYGFGHAEGNCRQGIGGKRTTAECPYCYQGRLRLARRSTVPKREQ